ncbi:hypothetical protein CP985_13295, partial [Malaciobacter mytili LMG 24559]
KESDSISNSIKEVSGGASFEKLEADSTAVSTTISDDEDVVKVKLSGDTSVTEGENAAYKVTLTDENGKAVIAKEDMEVKFTYTYTTASGEDITEVKTVTIKAGQSEVSFEVETVDNVYKEGDESFKININTVSNTNAFEKITIDSTPVETTIKDDVDNVNVNLVASGEEREYKLETIVKGSYADITTFEDGTYAMTWITKNSDGFWETSVQKFDNSGNKLGDTVVFSENAHEAARRENLQIESFEDGSYIVVWLGKSSDELVNNNSLYTQRFNPDGTKDGSIIEMNIFKDSSGNIYKDITTFPDGSYIIVWQNKDNNLSINVQKFNADGTTDGNIVNLNSAKWEYDPKIVTLADGSYAVSWWGNDSEGDMSIFVQQFNSDGSKVGEMIQLEGVNKTDGRDQHQGMESLSDGSYIVTWYGENEQGTWSCFTQKFNSDGTLSGSTIELKAPNYKYNYNKETPQITELADGTYIIGWWGQDEADLNTNFYIQKFNSDGTLSGEVVQIDANGTSWALKLKMTELLDGSYVVTWSAYNSQGKFTLFAQQFNSDGTPATEVTEVLYDSYEHSVTVLADGSYIVTSSGYWNEGSIKVQKFNADGSMVIEEGDTISEGETATYEVTLTDDDGNEVIAKEDMVVTFKYTFTTLDGENIEKVGTVTIKAGESSVSIDIKTLDDVYAEDAEKFYIEIVSITNADQFEKVTIDEIGVETIIKDDTPADNVNINLVASGEEREYTTEKVVNIGFGPQITALKDGGYVVTWFAQNSTGKLSLFLQQYNANDEKIGDTVEVKGAKDSAKIVSLEDGGYILSCANYDYGTYVQQFNSNGSKVGETIGFGTDISTIDITLLANGGYAAVGSKANGEIFIQQFDADGVKVGEIEIIKSTPNSMAKITELNDGGYVVLWREKDSQGNYSLFVQQFNSDGSKDGSAVQLEASDFIRTNDAHQQIETLEDGSYVVTWSGLDSQGDFSIFVQQFNSDGSKAGEVVQLEALDNTTGNDFNPQITILANGGYVITWSGSDSQGTSSIFVQQFDSDGSKVEETVQLEKVDNNVGADISPQIIALKDGSYVVTWQGVDAGGDWSIFVQKFNPDGTMDGENVKLESIGNTAGFDINPQITVLADGSYIVTWEGSSSSERPIYTQKFNADGSRVIEEGDTISEGETATYEVTLTDDDGNKVIAKEDMIVTFKYTFTTLDGKNIEKVGTVTIKAGESSTSIDIKTLDDVYAEDAEKFYIEIVSITNTDQFEKVTIDEIGVETIIKDDTPGDTVNIKLSGDSTVEEGNSATYKVALTDENGKAVIAKEDMEVKFTYTYTTASGEDITEVKTVTIKAGESEASFEVETVDNVYKESDEKFEISIDSVTNTDQFEKVAIDDSSVETTIKDDVDNINVKIEGIETDVIEGESAKYKVTLTDDNGNPIVALEDMKVSVKYTYKDPTTNEDIVEVKEVTIPKGATEVDFEVEIVNDNYLVEPDSTGDVTVINTGHGSGNQSAPIVTKLDNGDVLYVWGDNTSSNTSNYLKGKIYDAFGNVKVDTFTISDKSASELNGDYWFVKGLDIKVMDNGNIIIGYAAYDGSQKPIMTVIDPSKDSSSSEFFVNKDVSIQQNDTTTHESAPILTVLSDGRLLAVYVKNIGGGSNATVYGRIFDANGNAVSDEFRVGKGNVDQTTWGNHEQNIYVEELSNGKVVVGIANEYGKGGHKPIVNIIDPTKNPTDSDFSVASDVDVRGKDNPGAYESAPRIVELDGGKFMTIWYGGAGSDNAGSYRKLYARVFNEDGTAATDQFVLTQNSIDGWSSINVPLLNLETLSNGNIVVGWVRNTDNSGNDAPMIAVIDSSTGKVIPGSETQVNTSTASGHTYAGPAIVKALGDGNFVAVWHDTASSDAPIYYRIFDSNGKAISDQVCVTNGTGSLLDSVDNLAWDSISVEVTDDNSFIIGWIGNNSSSLDGSGTSVVSVTVDLGKNEGENHFEVSIDKVVSGGDGYEKVVVDDNAINTTINEPDNMYLDQVINLSNFINDSTQPTTNEIDLTNNTLDSIIIKDESVEDLTNNQHLLKIFGDESKEDRVKLEGNWEKSNTQETIDGEKFNVYQNGNSNIKILIDEDISVDPTI